MTFLHYLLTELQVLILCICLDNELIYISIPTSAKEAQFILIYSQ